MDKKVVFLKDYKKLNNKNSSKMLFAIILLGGLFGLIFWHYFVENIAALDVEIPRSSEITYNSKGVIGVTSAQIANEFDSAQGKPVLLYIYTTWCRVCTKHIPIINEISKEFQNTDLEIITIAIDRDLDENKLKNHLNRFGNLYFQPKYLVFKEGFVDFLLKRNIKYKGRIPFTVLFAKDGSVITKFSGSKSKNYLRNKIIKELF